MKLIFGELMMAQWVKHLRWTMMFATLLGSLFSFRAYADTASEILVLVNEERSSAGLSSLQLSRKLSAAAQAHAEDMALKGFMGHTGSDGSSPADRVTAAGYDYVYVGENVGEGYTTPQTMMQGWMGSTGHKANILSKNYTQMGVGYKVAKDGTAYWAQTFGRPSTLDTSDIITVTTTTPITTTQKYEKIFNTLETVLPTVFTPKTTTKTMTLSDSSKGYYRQYGQYGVGYYDGYLYYHVIKDKWTFYGTLEQANTDTNICKTKCW